MTYEYRVVGINITQTSKPDSSRASEKLNISKEFIEKEFSDHYQSSDITNTALQLQRLLEMYGKRGWKHYYEGRVGNQVLLYFIRHAGKEIKKIELTPEELATVQMLSTDQLP